MTAEHAWGVMVAGIVAYEAYAAIKLEDQLLTDGASRFMQRYPLVTSFVIGSTALHLMGVYKTLGIRYLDPLHMTGRGVGKATKWLSDRT